MCQCKYMSNYKLFMYTHVCGHMQEGLVNAFIDIYESEPTSAHTLTGHGV